ncbi:MAG: TauD/TfdA family dioxygenase [Hyphomonadaceae bacterium]
MATLAPPPTASETIATIVARGGQRLADVDEAALIGAYTSYGAVLLRGFAPDLDAFGAFTARYCSGSVFNESGGRQVLNSKNLIQTVNLGDEAFPLHPELSREPWKPDVCFFWCDGAPSAGGETTVCDGVELVKRLPTSAYDALRTRRLRYVMPATPSALAYWLGTPTPSDAVMANPPQTCPYTFERTARGIVRVYSPPALHKPMFASDLAFGNFLLFARYMNNNRNFPLFENGDVIPDDLVHQIKTTSDAITLPVAWRPGDLLMLDNTRFMHGRNKILDCAERKIATYFGFLTFAKPGADEIVDPPWRRGVFVPP